MTKLYVGNLSYATGSAELRQLFEPYGNCAVRVLREASRGFGVVEYESADGARSACVALDGASIDGRTISVRGEREGHLSARFA